MGKGDRDTLRPSSMTKTKPAEMTKMAESPDTWRRLRALRDDIIALETVIAFLRARSSLRESEDEVGAALRDELDRRVWELWLPQGH